MGRKYKSATFSLTPDQIASLEAIADSLGYRWGERGNISAMLKAIADGQLAVGDYLKKPITNSADIKAKLGEIEELLEG